MRKFTLIIICLILCAFAGMAQNYIIHSTSPSVKVVSGASSSDASKGMKLKGTDALVIPEGGAVEIYNTFDKRIYKSLRPGKITITKLLIEARQVAADNSKNIGSRLNLGKNGKGGKQMYTEKGMVTRTLCEVDSTAVDSINNGKAQVNKPLPCDSTACKGAACDTIPGK